MTSPKASAKEILNMMQYLFEGPDHIVPAFETEFPHIDFSKYRGVEATLSLDGYQKLSDLELVNLSNDPTSMHRKTLIRTFVSCEGGIVVACYEVKPNLIKLLKLLVRGLLAFRWIDAPTAFINMIPARFIIDFETELSNGTFVTTSNASMAGLLKNPPTIDELFLPFKTGLEEIKKIHEKRVQSSIRDGITTLNVRSDIDLLELQKRLKLEKSAHRSSCDWITYDEIAALCQGQTELAKIVYEELRKMIEEQKAKHDEIAR